MRGMVLTATKTEASGARWAMRKRAARMPSMAVVVGTRRVILASEARIASICRARFASRSSRRSGKEISVGIAGTVGDGGMMPGCGRGCKGLSPVREAEMDDETFNMSMRKYLKQVGVTSQQAIERHVREHGDVAGRLKVRTVRDHRGARDGACGGGGDRPRVKGGRFRLAGQGVRGEC